MDHSHVLSKLTTVAEFPIGAPPLPSSVTFGRKPFDPLVYANIPAAREEGLKLLENEVVLPC